MMCRTPYKSHRRDIEGKKTDTKGTHSLIPFISASQFTVFEEDGVVAWRNLEGVF